MGARAPHQQKRAGVDTLAAVAATGYSLRRSIHGSWKRWVTEIGAGGRLSVEASQAHLDRNRHTLGDVNEQIRNFFGT
jgi:hypothetical protein